MGMYTGLRGWIEIKEEYQHFFKQLEYDDFDWGELSAGTKTEDFSKLNRSKMIPFGGICYMDETWNDHVIDFDGKKLFFTCSLKNYSDEIEYFIEALPEFAYRWELEERYEEWEFSTFHIYKGVF